VPERAPPDPAATPSPDIDPARLEALAGSVAIEAADLLRRGLGQQRRIIRNKSTITDLVTEMDRAAEQLIVERLLASRPDDGVFGEEGTAHPGASAVSWIVDPLDGTTNYVYGFPAFAVSIAARVHDPAAPAGPTRVVAGAVADVARGDLFAAHAGGGATRDGEPLACSDRSELATALVATGFSYESERRARQARVLTTVLPTVRDIRRTGSAALDLCAVASGRVDAYYERGLGEWDFAAGALIATEAGAVVGGLDELTASSNFVLAAPAALADALRSLLRRAGAGEA
jgi:myo-inositol-1(or 4)-monophosphatase